MDKARELAAEAVVPVLLEFRFEGCVHCARMAKGPLREPRVVELSRKYVCVKIDLTTEQGEALAGEWELVGTPVFAVLDPLGNVVLTRISHQPGAVAALCRSGIRKNSDVTRYPVRNSCESRYGW